MKITEAKNYVEMSEFACQLVIERNNSLNKPVLGLATGSTPIGTYQYLIQQYQAEIISFRNTTTFNLDEYIGLAADHPNSYQSFMKEQLFQHIDIPSHQTHIPDGTAENMQIERTHYETKIKEAGGIDLQILGIGENGHIGFNEPGTPFQKETHLVELNPSTREANARFFKNKQQVPTQAITMGISTIMKSKEILLLVSGTNKKEAYSQLLNTEVTEKFPASILKQHNNCKVIVDKGAIT